MAFGLDLGEDAQERLVGTDEEGCPLDADDFLAVHVLFLEDPKLFADFFVYISKERIRKVVLCLEFGLGFGRVAGDAEDDGAGVLELFEGVTKAAGFDGAAGSVGAGIEEEDDGFSGEVAEVDGVFLIVLKREVGDFLVQFHKSSFRWGETASYRLLLRRVVMSRSSELGLRPRCRGLLAGWTLAAGLFATAHAQYPGRVNPNDGATKAPVLRATAVLEYTGDLTKPTAARLIPVAVWDGERYQPGGLYMAQPMPLTVESGTIYELQEAGRSKGLFDVKAAANVSGSWVATGTYQKPAPPKASRLKPSKTQPQFVHDAGAPDDGKPHFAHRPPAETGSASGSGSGQSTGTGAGSSTGSGSGSSTGSGSGSGTNSSSSSDSDRPTLHRRTDSTTGEQSPGSESGTGSGSSTSSSSPDVDPDRPTLHRRADDSGSGSASPAPDVDPDRPTLRKRSASATNPNDNGAPVTATTNIDPDRPRLGYGKPEELEKIDVPTSVQIAKLAGGMDKLKLMAAVSDAKTREPHSYVYSWTDPEEAQKMQAALEDAAKNLLAGNALHTFSGGSFGPGSGAGNGAGGAAAQKSTRTVTNSRVSTAHKAAAAKPALPDLADEQFKAYELSFGGGATLVFSAKSGQGDQTKFVTIIAEPDFNGVPQILFKQVTSEAELDVVPRMQLVDAMDTDADNRAELIFELAGKTDQQFAIYKVQDRSVEQVFSTGGGQ